MKRLRTRLPGIGFVVLALGATMLYAQPAATPPPEPVAQPAGDVAPPQSPAQMIATARSAMEQMVASQKHVQIQEDAARKQKDVIKLNCISDKLLQINELVKIAASSFKQMRPAGRPDPGEIAHLFSMVTLSRDRVQSLRDEASGCVGEEVDYQGDTANDTAEPDVPDDPTEDDPLDDPGPVEPPGYASPFE